MMEEKLEELWNAVGSKISQIVNERQDELSKLKIEAVVHPSMCAEGGFMVGYYPEAGFDIRACGWTPGLVKRNPKWYKSIHCGTHMGNTFSIELYKFADELAKEAQKVWDNGISILD